MNIPKQLSEYLIEYIDLNYLSESPNSGDSESYLYFARNMMATDFSISWSKGGTYGSCWDGEEGPSEVSGQDEPSIEKLNSFINKHYPEMDSKYYKYILNCMDEGETPDHDWYGGCTYEGYKNMSFYSFAQALIDTVYSNVDENEFINFEDLLNEHANIVINISACEYYKIALKKNLIKDLPIKIGNEDKQKI